MAKFQRGHKLAKGGKRPGAGRKRKEEVAIRKAAAQVAKEYIEASVKPVMHTYFQLAHGRLVNKYHEGAIVGQEFEADAATTRHFVDKLLPEMKPDGQERPVAIQIIVEAAESGNGHYPGANGNGAQAPRTRGRGAILIGGD